MTGADMRAARAKLGELWGLGRPLHKAEMGRACYLAPSDPGQPIGDYERPVKPVGIPRPVAALVRLYLKGVLPPDGLEVIRAS
jgi:hypothetical protein